MAVTTGKSADATAIRPLTIELPEAENGLRARIAATRWPEMETVADQRQCVQLATMERRDRAAAGTGRDGHGAGESAAVVASGGKAAGIDVVRMIAERACASTSEVDGSHVIMISQPQAVKDVIIEAVAAVGAAAAAP